MTDRHLKAKLLMFPGKPALPSNFSISNGTSIQQFVQPEVSSLFLTVTKTVHCFHLQNRSRIQTHPITSITPAP